MIELERELQGTYKTIQISESQWEAEMTASATWSYYLGHFPEQAVLPAVAIIDISQFLLSQISTSSGKISKIQDFRIKNPVRPGDKIKIQIQQKLPGSFHILWLTLSLNLEDQKMYADLTIN